jgi:putative ABC transport system substrate-binding protein
VRRDQVLDRRRFLLTSLAGVLAAPLAAEAQPAGRVYRLGILASTPTPHLQEAFRQGLRDLGWIESQNITVEYRYSEARFERLPDLMAQLIRSKVDVIVAWDGLAAGAAKQATKSIPIVVLIHGDPVGSGHVASLAKPGGNLTGLGGFFPVLAAKRLELIKQAIPGLARVAVLWHPANPVKQLDWKATQAAALALALTIQSREVRSSEDFPGVFQAIRRERPDALMTLEDPLIFRHRTMIVEFAARDRLPAIYALREFTDVGGLMTYGVDVTDLFRRGATFVDKILKGAKPADLPIEQPTKFDLVINLKTAKALGLTIPPSLLAGADQVIE